VYPHLYTLSLNVDNSQSHIGIESLLGFIMLLLFNQIQYVTQEEPTDFILESITMVLYIFKQE